MRAGFQGLLCLVTILGMIILAGQISWPDAVRVVPPAPALHPELARLSGVWASKDVDRQVVVEHINETWALVVHVWAPGHWERVHGLVLRDGTIHWGYPVRYTLRWADTGAVFEREGGEGRVRFPLSRVDTPPGLVTSVAALRQGASIGEVALR